MLPQEIIRRKRDGAALTADEIGAFVRGITDGGITEGQVAAFAMAVFLRGMATDETVALTLAMRDSGAVLDWRALGIVGPVVDKHSTGGIGDKVSLILGPLLAACGAFVPMISGRGLGHTGGTLDKLASIPGYRVDIGAHDFARVVREVGCAIIGQTADLAPADRRLYAVRDVTATVESLPLITASILSKKFAEGTQALVMDVKVGSGAFMAGMEDARALARSLVDVARGGGVPTVALLTDMDQALGHAVGNAVEVAECIAFLRGDRQDARLREVTLALAREALALCGLDAALAAARLDDGGAAERFGMMVRALGGPDLLLDRAGALPPAPVVRAVAPPRPGFLAAMDARAVGVAVVELGGGRTRADAGIDPRVGFTEMAGLGAELGPERPLALVHAADEAGAERAARRLQDAVTMADAATPVAGVVRERVA